MRTGSYAGALKGSIRNSRHYSPPAFLFPQSPFVGASTGENSNHQQLIRPHGMNQEVHCEKN